MPQGQRVCPRVRGVAPGAEWLPEGVPPKFGAPIPKMVSGHNLQHMAPFGALTGGFCMLFDSPMFDPGPHFWNPQPQIWVLGGQGPFLGPKRGPEKHNFVEGSVPHEVSQDLLRGEWLVWYSVTLWVYQFPPNPS